MRFEQDAACRGTHCASTPLPTIHRHHHLHHHHNRRNQQHQPPRSGPAKERVETSQVLEGAKTVLCKGEPGGPGMAYPAPTAALNRHSPFSSSSTTSSSSSSAVSSVTVAAAAAAVATTPTSTSSNPNGHLHGATTTANRPTDFSVSSLLTAATTNTSPGSASSPPLPAPQLGSPGAPDSPSGPSPGPTRRERELAAAAAAAVHNAPAVASYFEAAALAAAGFYNPAHLPPVSSPSAHHLQSKAILAGAHHHPQFNPQGIGPPGSSSDWG